METTEKSKVSTARGIDEEKLQAQFEMLPPLRKELLLAISSSLDARLQLEAILEASWDNERLQRGLRGLTNP